MPRPQYVMYKAQSQHFFRRNKPFKSRFPLSSTTCQMLSSDAIEEHHKYKNNVCTFGICNTFAWAAN